MKIAIISDIHDNIANLETFFQTIKKEEISKIICLGDITNSETLKKLAKNFSSEIFLIYGNAEIYSEAELKNYKNINYLERLKVIKIDGLKIGLCHEPGFIRKLFQEEPNLDFVFYGHTHKPWISIKNKATMANPGTLGGVFQRPSWAIFDTITKKLKLKLIHL